MKKHALFFMRVFSFSVFVVNNEGSKTNVGVRFARIAPQLYVYRHFYV